MNKINRDVEFDLENDAKRCIDRAGHPDAGDRGIPADAHKDVLRVTQIFENPHFFSMEGAANGKESQKTVGSYRRLLSRLQRGG
jgi:hypothetical protein